MMVRDNKSGLHSLHTGGCRRLQKHLCGEQVSACTTPFTPDACVCKIVSERTRPKTRTPAGDGSIVLRQPEEFVRAARLDDAQDDDIIGPEAVQQA